MEGGLEYLKTLKPWAGQGGFRLEPMRQVMDALGNPQDSYRTVHVAGTNGKGSVSAMIASGLGSAGYKVGLNISPHLIELNERFVVDGVSLSDRQISQAALKVKDVADKEGILLSLHEALTAIAFVSFREAKVDYAVIEVGLGGRLDASNVINNPEAVVITSIGYDHVDILGDSLESIAYQKAGIIKKGRAVIVGEMDSSALDVIKSEARSLNSSCFVLNEDFFELGGIQIALNGVHQRRNGAVAAKTLELLGISCTDIKNGLSNVYWPARLEEISYQSRRLLFDCAHNPAGMNTLCNYLKAQNLNEIIVVFGAISTKSWREMIDMLCPFASEWHILEPSSLSAVRSEDIGEYLSCNNIKVATYGDDYRKFINNINDLDPNKLILCTGSIYLLGTLRSLLDIHSKPLWKPKR